MLAIGMFLAVTPDCLAAEKFDFKDVDKNELMMKDNPKQSGAHAMILEWRNYVDDSAQTLMVYQRLKIFTREGLRYADVQIPYLKDFQNLHDFKARTIHEDGSIVPLDEKLLDKSIVKIKGIKLNSKSFSLPEVQPGSIIEYMYKLEGLRVPHSWTLQGDLYVKRALIHWRPIGGLGTNCLSIRTPNREQTNVVMGTQVLDVTDIPSFENEAFLPPDATVKTRLQCWYSRGDARIDESIYWDNYTKSRFPAYEIITAVTAALTAEVNSISQPADSSEDRLRKVYSRVQKIRNLTYESDKTLQELKREKLKEIRKIKDVMKNGYGDAFEINMFFAALARAMGMEVNIVQLSSRDEIYFNKNWKNDSLLDHVVVEIKLDGKYIYFDPGIPCCPFGHLHWRNSGVAGLRIMKEKAEWIISPSIQPEDAMMQRLAQLKYDDGILHGKIFVAYLGQRALSHRLQTMLEDENEQHKLYEDEIKDLLVLGSNVKCVKISNDKDPASPLMVEFDVEIPWSGMNAGTHILFPMDVFQANGTNPLTHESRKYPVNFNYAFTDVDDVSIEMPLHLEVEHMPSAAPKQFNVGRYASEFSSINGKLQFTRKMTIVNSLYPLDYYESLRLFFTHVDQSDKENVVLREKQTP